MATLIWTGVTDGDFSKAANFIDESTGVAPASPPANSDTIKFDRGAVDVDAGLTTGLTGLTIIGTRNYAGRIAPGGALSATFTLVRWSAGYLSLTGNITTGNIACRRGEKFNYAGGTATDLWLGCDATLTGVVTNLRGKGSYVVDDADATAYTLAHLTGGMRLYSKRGGVYDVGAGCVVETLTDAQLGDESYIRSGGRIKVKSNADTVDAVEVEPNGTLDLSECPKAITIGTLRRWEGANVNLFTQAGAATVSSEVVYGLSYGGMATSAGSPIPL